MKNILYVFLVLSLLFSCIAVKKTDGEEIVVEQKTMPEWVNQRPQSTSYYIGIAQVVKKTYPLEYKEVAKKNALNALASEVSVFVSTQSVLSQLEYNDQYKEQFTQDIKISVNEQLEGYDLVDSYEDKENYYVYYQLSKADYHAKKQKAVKDAMNQGYDFLLKSRIQQKELHYKEALVSYLSGIDKIKNHLDQSLEMEVSGQKIYLGNELFTGYRSLINEMVIDASEEVYRIKIGANGNIKFLVKNQEGKTLSGIPLLIEVKRKTYSYLDVVTDLNGTVNVEVGKVVKQTQEQYVSAQLNLKQIIKEAGVSSLTYKLATLVNTLSEKILIEIQPVYVLIKSQEKANDKQQTRTVLDIALKEGLTPKGFIAVSSIEKADIVVEINGVASDAGKVNEIGAEFYSSIVNVDIVFKNKNNGTEIYQTAVNSIKGTQLSLDKAVEDAFYKAAKKVKLNVVDEFVKIYSE